MTQKTLIVIVAALFLGTGLAQLSFAEEMKQMEHKGMMHQGMMMEREEAQEHGMPGRCPLSGMVAENMMAMHMMPASDGGIIVLAGNKLLKYDKDLNLVKEIEIKIDVEAIKNKMEEVYKNCMMLHEEVMEQEKAEEGKEMKSEKPKTP